MAHRLRPSRLLTRIGPVALALIVGAGGWAFAAPKSHTIHACVSKKSGVVRIVKKCGKRERRITWNTAGPRGPAGQRGPSGAAGAAGAPGAQGPGATHMTFQAAPAGTTASPFQNIGTLGKWTFYARCINDAGNVRLDVETSGPGGTTDTSSYDYSSASPGTTDTGIIANLVPSVPASSPALFDQNSASASNKFGRVFDITISYDDGSIVQAHITDVASNVTSGPLSPFCRVSAVWYPVS
jgi:hypothetical protein